MARRLSNTKVLPMIKYSTPIDFFFFTRVVFCVVVVSDTVVGCVGCGTTVESIAVVVTCVVNCAFMNLEECVVDCSVAFVNSTTAVESLIVSGCVCA